MAVPRRATLIGGVVALALIGGGAAYAATSSGSTTPAAAPATSAPAQPAPKAQGKHPAKRAAALDAMLARVEHGELTVAGAANQPDGPQVIDVQRGVVTTADPTSLTVRSADGYTATYTITPTTARGKAVNLQPNESVQVVATKTPTGVTATRITPVKALAQPGSPS